MGAEHPEGPPQPGQTAIREALDSGELSISQGYNLMRQLQNVPEENRTEAAAQVAELVKAQKEISQLDAEAERRGKIAGLFCKVFEWAVLLTPTEENVRLWVEGTRMRPDEVEDSAKETVYFRHLIHEDDLKGRSNELNHAMHASLNKVYSNVRQIVRHQRTGELDADAVAKIRFLADQFCGEIYLLANQK